MALAYYSFGPFTKGVSDSRNTALESSGYARYARHLVFEGAGVLKAHHGSSVVMTLMDDAGTPAEITSVCEVVQWSDGVLVVGHSTATDKAYLYRLDDDLTGWYNLAGSFTASTTATPLATALWTSMTEAPVVTVSEMSGEAHIACTNAQTGTALQFPTRVFTGSAINDLTANLDASGGDETVYALGVFSFQAHRWMWGMGSGTVVANTYRPELLRFGGPNGGGFAASGSGSIAVGHRVRSAREAVVGACVAGEVAYVGTTYSLWPIVGFGADTWDKSKPLDDSFGFAGPKCAVAVNGVCYYWSPRGPMRVAGLNRPEPLWDAIPETVQSVVDSQKIVAAFDPDHDQVVWFHRSGTATGNQKVCAFDIRRNAFLGPDRDVGIVVGAANYIAPVTAANVSVATAPAGAPTSASTTNVYALSALANWTNGDTSVGVTTEIQYRRQGTTTWTNGVTSPAGGTSATLSGLTASTAYEWRCAHIRNGQYSSYLGPSGSTQFTTLDAELAPPTLLTLEDNGPGVENQGYAYWTNSGETGVSTEVYLDGVYYTTAGVGESSVYLTVYATDTYAVKVRHIKAGLTASAFTAEETQTFTVD